MRRESLEVRFVETAMKCKERYHLLRARFELESVTPFDLSESSYRVQAHSDDEIEQMWTLSTHLVCPIPQLTFLTLFSFPRRMRLTPITRTTSTAERVVSLEKSFVEIRH